MSKKEMIKVKFKFSFAHLKQLADNMVLLIDRDLVAFTDRGFTTAKRTQLVTKIDQFFNFSSDEQMQGIQMAATETKDTIRQKVEDKMRSFFLVARITFTENSGKYREFGNADISRQSDEELFRTAKTLKTTAIKYQSLLAAEGITTAKINEFSTLITDFDNAIDAQKIAISNRDLQTESRAILANELYDLCVKYAEIGQDIWRSQSESHYNDYIIYDTPSGTDETTPPSPTDNPIT
jgi:hypothetical protein